MGLRLDADESSHPTSLHFLSVQVQEGLEDFLITVLSPLLLDREGKGGCAVFCEKK